MATSGNWKPGRIPGTVITDDGNEIDRSTVHAATEFYGGRLIATGIRMEQDVRIIAESKYMRDILKRCVSSNSLPSELNAEVKNLLNSI